ncbi:MAG: hypothetical protein KAS90_05295 [Candidatus Aenigmarchaeota archaeon]|nr:hypothetical protein [Candidatus Aenigmarchaeota archaeon]
MDTVFIMANGGHVSNKFERKVSEILINSGLYEKAIIFNNIHYRYSTFKETCSAGKPLSIRMINGNGTAYEVDLVALGINQGGMDIIQASIKNSRFENLVPEDVNSAKLLGYKNIDRYYFDQTLLDLTDRQKAMKGEFEHFKKTWIYDYLDENGKLTGLQKQYLIVKSIKRQPAQNSLIFQDLTSNGIEIISKHELSEDNKEKSEVPITYISGLIINDMERDVIDIINSLDKV